MSKLNDFRDMIDNIEDTEQFVGDTSLDDYDEGFIDIRDADYEINSIVKNREYNIEDLESFVVISTIARLPYDRFLNIN